MRSEMNTSDVATEQCDNYGKQIEVAARLDRWSETVMEANQAQLWTRYRIMSLPAYEVWDWLE